MADINPNLLMRNRNLKVMLKHPENHISEAHLHLMLLLVLTTTCI